MGRILFLGVVMATAACAAFAQAPRSKPFPPGVVGIMRIDAGTDYVFLDRPTTIGGECKGWKAVSVQAPGPAGSGLTQVMCWKESKGLLLTATADKVTPQTPSMDVIR